MKTALLKSYLGCRCNLSLSLILSHLYLSLSLYSDLTDKKGVWRILLYVTSYFCCRRNLSLSLILSHLYLYLSLSNPIWQIRMEIETALLPNLTSYLGCSCYLSLFLTHSLYLSLCLYPNLKDKDGNWKLHFCNIYVSHSSVLFPSLPWYARYKRN